ncbi:hypothetical protein BDY21DRAFT_363640 [Lineolata rhizophorae]|uniref:VOC domain-containing protein n=1 Tax=Lineolata rhizophorae TaxID=578093 RepID=A0A6A6P2W8_9PEZI|nr:hypothetical protein BDY21DRAFT_363640 [Lineolata rhizophorae]
MSSEAEKWIPPPMGTPCWVEIPAADVPACKKFYADLFPTWDWKPATEQYTEEKIAMWSYGGKMGLSGGIVQVSAECKASEQKDGTGVTIYHFVESIEDTQKRVEELGGKTASEKKPEGENGWYMFFKDVAGNRFGIYQLKKSCSS